MGRLICVAGKNSIAVRVLRAILDRVAPDKVVVIPNRNDPGTDGWQPSLRAAALQMGVREVDLEDIYGIPGLIFLSLEFDRILRPFLLSSPDLYNIHFSVLPTYKGMYTAALPVLNGEPRSGVTLHFIDSGIDTGDIIDQTTFPIGPDDTARDLYFNCMKAGTDLVLRYLDRLLNPSRDLPRRPQPMEGSSYFGRDSLDFGAIRIDVRKTAWQIHNQVRAFTFREFQMPVVKNTHVRGSRILNLRSTEKPGSVTSETEFSMTLSTIDYDIEVFKDFLPEVIRLCEVGDSVGIARLVPWLASLNECDENGITPLLAAILGGHPELVNTLLELGADPTMGDRTGTLPIDLARTHPDESIAQELIAALGRPRSVSRERA